MAPFDITLVGKNLQTFKGTYKYLEEFLTQIEILHDLTDEQDKPIFIKYIYNFKLTTQVRNILGRSNRPTTFAELKKNLEDAYPNPRTLQQVLSELGAITQKNSSIAEFREKITELSNQLSMFEIANLTNPTQEMKDVVYKLSESVALNTFLKGVNSEYKQILLSNTPKTLNEAVERCVTAERSFHSENNAVYHINRNNNNYRNNQRQNNNRNSTYNYNNSNNHRTNNYGHNNNNNYRNNNNNYRNNNFNGNYDRYDSNYNRNSDRTSPNRNSRAQNNFNTNIQNNNNSQRHPTQRGNRNYRAHHYNGNQGNR